MKRHSFPGFSRRFNPIVFIVALGAAAFTLVSKVPGTALHSSTASSSDSQVSSASEWLRVVHVTDGDTIKLSNGERVRLVGIDTPELHESAKLHRDAERTGRDIATIKSMGLKAYQFTKSLVDGKAVRIELDARPRDKYGRLLAYVYLEDGTFVNAEIIKNGYAYLMTIPPNVRHAGEFKALFAEARRSRAGLWAEEPPGDDHEPSR